MKILLTIGHQNILLPDDTGISTVMKTLARGIVVDERLYKGIIELRAEGERQQLPLKLEMVPDTTQFLLNGQPTEVNKACQPKRSAREHPQHAGAKALTTGQRQLGY